MKILFQGDSITSELREHLAPRRHLVRGIAEEFGATFIPLQSLFDEAVKLAPAEYWAFDGIHATHAGFQLMADVWLEAARPLLFPRSNLRNP